jgi:hypothetical protein
MPTKGHEDWWGTLPSSIIPQKALNLWLKEERRRKPQKGRKLPITTAG